MPDVHINLNPGLPFNRKNTLLTSKLNLNLRTKLMKCYIWSTALYGAQTSESRSEIPWKVLKWDAGGDMLEWSCEKWSITESQWGKNHPTSNKKKEGTLDWLHLAKNCLLTHIIAGKIEVMEDEEQEVSSYWIVLMKQEARNLKRKH